MSKQPFATFMVELNYVVAGIGSIIDCDLRAPLSKGLDDFGCLRLRTASRRSSKDTIRATSSPLNRPRITVRDVHASIAGIIGCRSGCDLLAANRDAKHRSNQKR
jgi:hypothetical protein